jgi:hypothetical protein
MTIPPIPHEVWISHLHGEDRQEETHILAIRRNRPNRERVQTKPKRLFSASSAILDPNFPPIAWFVALFYCSLGTLYAGIHTVGTLFVYLFATTSGPRYDPYLYIFAHTLFIDFAIRVVCSLICRTNVLIRLVLQSDFIEICCTGHERE